MKMCSKCNQSYPLDTDYFHRNRRNPDGFFPWCKICRKEYDKAYHKKNSDRFIEGRKVTRKARHDWYNSLKMHPCVDCNVQFHPAAMTWDHLPDTEKLFNLGTIGKECSKSRVLKEIAKCELVCANCHAIRTWERLHKVSITG